MMISSSFLTCNCNIGGTSPSGPGSPLQLSSEMMGGARGRRGEEGGDRGVMVVKRKEKKEKRKRKTQKEKKKKMEAQVRKNGGKDMVCGAGRVGGCT